jgi:hypothetical protein
MTKFIRRFAAFSAVAWFLFVAAPTAVKAAPPRDEQIERWTRLLPPAPRGVGPKFDDREAWKTLADAGFLSKVVESAEKLLAEPMPELTDELYLDYSRTGNRGRCEKVLFQRQGRFLTFVLAECMENRGRFLPAIEESARAICGQKTWLLPAHDGNLANFNGKETIIDLNAAHIAWNMATARYWLGDKLSPAVRKLIADELERRIFAPLADSLSTGKPKMWWLTGTNNWNAVCLAGVTGAALATIESPRRRAWFAAAAEENIQHFLDGFTADGYCSEGLGYWNYGFSHYVLLAETLREASGGKVDLMAGEKVRRIARFGKRLEILPGVFPAFADCKTDVQPDPALTAAIDRRYGWASEAKHLRDPERANNSRSILYMVALFDLPCAREAGAIDRIPPGPPRRDWFPDAGVLVCRPYPLTERSLGAAMKGGHNAEHHNHNDVGSFVIAIGRSTPLLDPGGEIYTARTFGPRRYESNMLNSFGHPVPRVAGRLQETGRDAAAKVLKSEFTDETDTLVLDLAAAYKVKELKKLERTFEYSRRGKGKLVVADRVEFSSPQDFGTALITFDEWKQLLPGRIIVGREPVAVEVNIDAHGDDFHLTPEKIEEQLAGGRKPTRLGIDLTKPTTRAEITLTIEPAP